MIPIRYAIYWLGYRLRHRWPHKPLSYKLFVYVHKNVDTIAKAMTERAVNLGKLDD